MIAVQLSNFFCSSHVRAASNFDASSFAARANMASACCTSPCRVLQTRQQALESKDLTDLTNEAKYNFQKPWQVVKIIGQADTTEQLDLLAHPFHSFAFAQGSQRHRNLAAGIGNVCNKNQQAKQDPKSGGIL